MVIDPNINIEKGLVVLLLFYKISLLKYLLDLLIKQLLKVL